MTNTAPTKKTKTPRGLARAQRRLRESAQTGKLDRVPSQQAALARLQGKTPAPVAKAA